MYIHSAIIEWLLRLNQSIVCQQIGLTLLCILNPASPRVGTICRSCPGFYSRRLGRGDFPSRPLPDIVITSSTMRE